MSALSIFAVDDEPLAIARIEQILRRIPNTVLIGSAASCAEALEKLTTAMPDVLLLDISMRDGSGFDLLDSVPEKYGLAVIFVTAFDHFAVRAFETSAVDYVLKPISVARMRDALERARTRLDSLDAMSQLTELRAAIGNLRRQMSATAAQKAELWIRGASGTMVRVFWDDVEWIKSEEDYVRLYTRSSGSYLLRRSIRALMASLDLTEFVRVHRNAVVRRSAIRAVHRRALGRLEVELNGGTCVAAGRVYAKQLRDHLITAH